MKKNNNKFIQALICMVVIIGAVMLWNRDVTAYQNISEITDFSAYASSYGREDLATKYNKDNRLYLYDQLYNASVSLWNSNEDIAEMQDGKYVIAVIDMSGYSMNPDEVAETYYAFQNDNPIFYFASNTITVSGDTFYFLADEEYGKASVRNQCKSYIIKGLNEFGALIEKESTTSAKVLAIHDRIVEKINYAYESDGVTPSEATWAHNIMGYFDDSISKGVCECYANVMHLALNMAGIENYYITGKGLKDAVTMETENHAWNYVRMEDGGYYYVDATWDDTTEGYRYFGKGASMMDDHFSNNVAGVGVEYLCNMPQVAQNDYVVPVAEDIKTLKDFRKIVLNPSGTYNLKADLDFSGLKATKPDDFVLDVVFKGTFNGNGHTISGITYGLFREIGEGATVKNLKLQADFGTNAWKGNTKYYSVWKNALAENNRGTVSNCDLTYVMNEYAYNGQGVAIGGLLYANYGKVEACDGNIIMNNPKIDTSVWHAIQASSVATFHWGGTISNCTANVNVKSDVKNDNLEIAIRGIVSDIDNGAIVTKCTAGGSIQTKDKISLAYAGIVNNLIKGEVSDCVNNCNVDACTGSTLCSAGIVVSNGATVKNCTNNGNFYNRYASIMEGYSREIGGICGVNGSKIIGCKNNGNITVEIGAGGGIFATAHGDSTVEGCSNSGKITGVQASSWMTCVGGIGGEIAFNSGTFDENGNFVMDPSGSCAITNCTNSGVIKAEYGAGCMVGSIHLPSAGNKVTVKNCKNTGSCENYGQTTNKLYYQYVGGETADSKLSLSGNTNLTKEGEAVDAPKPPFQETIAPTAPPATTPVVTEPVTEETETATIEDVTEETTEETTEDVTEETTEETTEDVTEVATEEITTESQETESTETENDEKGDKKISPVPFIVIGIILVAAGVVTFILIRKNRKQAG